MTFQIGHFLEKLKHSLVRLLKLYYFDHLIKFLIIIMVLEIPVVAQKRHAYNDRKGIKTPFLICPYSIKIIKLTKKYNSLHKVYFAEYETCGPLRRYNIWHSSTVLLVITRH